MTEHMLKLDRSQFPQRPSNFITIKLLPVIYRPIIGSPDQFVVGVLSYVPGILNLVRVNRIDRLHAFYGENAPGVLLAVEIGLDDLEAAAKEDSFDPSTFAPGILGICLGEAIRTEATSLEMASHNWLLACSSLHA
jgi:hypothetical protein